MNREAAIRTEGLTKRYGEVVAVDDLSFTVERGEIFGFLGPNGSGKSTTMRMLLGLARPTSGEAWVLGHNVTQALPDILRQTGSLIENPTFYPFLSGRDNLRVVARITDVPDTQVEEALQAVEMIDAAHRPFKEYSLGMKQRIGVASALLNGPTLLILDEPTNGLDPAGIVEMRNLIRRLKEQGRTVFVSSHVLHEIEQVCDRIAILNRGTVVAQGPVHALLGQSQRIEVTIANPDRAMEIIRDIPWVENVTRDGPNLLVEAPAQRSAEINEALARQELYASSIAVREESLERYFLDVTGAEK